MRWDRPVPSCGFSAVVILALGQLRWWESWGCMDNTPYSRSGGSQMLMAHLPEGGLAAVM